MGRALPLTTIDDAARTQVAEYAQIYLAKALNITLAREGLLLRNTTTGSTYFVAPVLSSPNGMMDLYLTADYVPVGASGATTLVVGFDIADSTFYVMEHSVLMRVANGAMQHGGTYAGVTFMTVKDQILMRINLREAIANKVIPRVFGFKGQDAFNDWRLSFGATPEQFVHLHVHSGYSILDGACTIEGIARQAKLNGQPAIALTDHGQLFGTYKHWKACKEAEVKPIMGVEAYLVPDVNVRFKDRNGHDTRFEYHITLIAMNEEGWANLCEMITISNRLPNKWYANRIDLAMLAKYNAGILVLTGCFKGVVMTHLMDHDPVITQEKPFLRKDVDYARQMLRWLKATFPGRCFGEKMKIVDFKAYDAAIPLFDQMCREEELPMVITNDAHYETEADWEVQAMISRISKDRDGDRIGESKVDPHPHWIKPMSLMQHPSFSAQDFANTCEIAERCTLDFTREKFLFPDYPYEQDADWQAFQQYQQRAAS